MPKTTSGQLRSETLDLIVDNLQHPEQHGDQFFVKFVNNASRYKQGYMAIGLLRSMVKELNKVPAEYIVHCALSHPDRVELSADCTRLRLANTFKDTILGRETDPYGFIVEHSDTEEIQEPKNRQEERPMTGSEDMSSDKPIARDTNQTSSSVPVIPVLFVNGRFYEDDQMNGRAPNDEPAAEVIYDKPEFAPLGQKNTRLKSNVCWNCGQEGHAYTACPEPRNQNNIVEARELFGKESNTSYGRFFEELAFQNRIAAMAPGKLSSALRDALQIKEDEEPPYYSNMKRYGYPPGYYGAEEGEDPLTGRTQRRRGLAAKKLPVEDLSDSDTILKVYDGQEEDKTDCKEEEKQIVGSQSITRGAKFIKLVHYPGLNLEDSSGNVDIRQSHDYDPSAHYYYYSYATNHEYSSEFIPPSDYYAYSTTSTSIHSHEHFTHPTISDQPKSNAIAENESDMDISDDDE